MANNSANVHFREHVRRTTTGFQKSPTSPIVRDVDDSDEGHDGGSGAGSGAGPDERTPLLLPGSNGNGSAHPGDDSVWRKVKQVLLDRRATPGTDSPNPFIKWPARWWNVFKVTMLSSMNPSLSPDATWLQACGSFIANPMSIGHTRQSS